MTAAQGPAPRPPGDAAAAAPGESPSEARAGKVLGWIGGPLVGVLLWHQAADWFGAWGLWLGWLVAVPAGLLTFVLLRVLWAPVLLILGLVTDCVSIFR